MFIGINVGGKIQDGKPDPIRFLGTDAIAPERLVLPFRRRRTFYLETSAWDVLQRRGGLQSDWGRALERAISNGRLSVVAGAIVFDEVLPLYKADPARGDARLELIAGLADLSRTIRHAPDILREHVMAALCGDMPPAPFTSLYADIPSARSALIAKRSQIAELMAPNVAKDLASEREMRSSRKGIREELRKAGWPKIDFPQFLELESASFQSFIDHYFGSGTPLPAQVLGVLATSRPLRMYRDGLLAMLYEQTVLNRAPRASDLRDLHHAVAASLTDGLVTNDRGFREWCRRVTLPKFEVLTLAELLGE